MGLRSISLRVLSSCLLAGCLGWPNSAKSQVAPATHDATSAATASPAAVPTTAAEITIPGPLRSFLRMAAVSQEVSPDDVLPLLARNVVTDGYQGHGESSRPTEYLVLLKRYIAQARELLALAGPDGVIRVSDCQAAAPLLKALGYQLMSPCGPTAAVQTADPERAFLTIDSGFPLTDLEAALEGIKPFSYPYPRFEVPVLFSPDDWTRLERNTRAKVDVLDCLILDPRIARLYWGMSRMDARTQAFLRRSPGLEKLLPLAPVLDFYGSNLSVRAGRVEVPGGASAGPAWSKLVGASPDSPEQFTLRLLGKDQGWLAAYFDALSRISRSQQAYFTAEPRLARIYAALRGKNVDMSPVRPVFRPDAGLLLLAARVQIEPNGQPHIPGNLEVWQEYLHRRTASKVGKEWGRRAAGWNSPEQLLEALFAFSRVYSEEDALRLFLVLNEIDRGRAPEQRLSPPTVRWLAADYDRFKDQYRVFCEYHNLDNTSISAFLRAAEAVDRIRKPELRADAIGLFQADIGFWKILARQGEIAPAVWNNSWQRVVDPFAGVRSAEQLYDAARTSLGEVLRAATGKTRLSQDELLALLAGPRQASSDGQQVKQELASDIRSAFEAQRLVSLDALVALGDGLVELSQRKTTSSALLPLAGELREFQLPKPLFSASEKAEWTAGLANNPHLQAEMGTDLARLIKSARSPKDLAAARGLLVPFLRDTLVGLNYAAYAPLGSQLLSNNPLLVRSHDFSGEERIEGVGSWSTPTLVGRGWTAAGGVHLAGSLADLPYVLAELEENFIVPEHVQALVWEDLVPTLLTGSILPRWWRVSENELHAVALYQRFGEDLLRAAARDAKLRGQVMNIVEDRLTPRRFELVEEALEGEHPEEALAHLAPAETFYLGMEFRHNFPQQSGVEGKAGAELETLARQDPQAVSWERISADFGVPHPAFAQTYARELLPVKPLPTYLGYSSRLLAESWESNNLYWARLADEMGYSPVMLNLLAPELTRRMAGKIFATHLEDWAALLRALRQTGEEFRQGKIASVPKGRAIPGA